MKKVRLAIVMGIICLGLGCLLPDNASAYMPGDCTGSGGTANVNNEADLRAAVSDPVCSTIILDKPGVQDKGIQLSADFDGQGKTLTLGTSTYGLLADTYGLDGQTATPASLAISNVKIVANAASAALINIGDVAVTLKNVETDRTGNTRYMAHINVKEAASLTLNSYEAIAGTLVIDYSPAAISNNQLLLTVDAASAVSIMSSFRYAINQGVAGPSRIVAGDDTTTVFLANDNTIMGENWAVLGAEEKRELILDNSAPKITATVAGGKITFDIADNFAITEFKLKIDGVDESAQLDCGSPAPSKNMTCVLDLSALPEGSSLKLTVDNGYETTTWTYMVPVTPVADTQAPAIDNVSVPATVKPGTIVNISVTDDTELDELVIEIIDEDGESDTFSVALLGVSATKSIKLSEIFALVDGKTYSVRIRAIDVAGNVSQISVFAFLYSNPAPAPTPSKSPSIIVNDETIDNRHVIIIEGGAEDEKIAETAKKNPSFADFLSRLDENAIFLELDDRGSCSTAGCAMIITVSGLAANTVYHLYHYDEVGNVTFVNSFKTDAAGNVIVTIEKFSGNVLTVAKITLAGSNNGLKSPNTGVMEAAEDGASASFGVAATLGAVFICVRLGFAARQRRE